MHQKLTHAIEKLNLPQENANKINELIPTAIAKSQVITQKEIDKIKEDIGEEKLKQLTKILSQIK